MPRVRLVGINLIFRFIVVTPGRHNTSIGYLTTGVREVNKLRKEHKLEFSEKMKAFLASQDFVDASGAINEKFGDTAFLYSKFSKVKEGLPALKDALAALHARGVDVGNMHTGDFETPEKVQQSLSTTYTRCTKAISASFTEPFMNRYSDSPFLTTDVRLVFGVILFEGP